MLGQRRRRWADANHHVNNVSISDSGIALKIHQNRALGHLCAHIGWTGPGEPPEDGEMLEMTLSSRHRIRNSSPGGLRPNTLPLGHGGSPQYWLSHVDGGETFFVSFKPPRPGTEPEPNYPRAPALLQKSKQHQRILQCMVLIVALNIAGALPVGLTTWILNTGGDLVFINNLYIDGGHLDNQFREQSDLRYSRPPIQKRL